MGALSELFLYFLLESAASIIGRGARRGWVHYAVSDRFEERVNDIPTRQCRIVAVDDDHDTKLMTVEWTTGLEQRVVPRLSFTGHTVFTRWPRDLRGRL
jgi:hypothetical protein